MERAAIRPVLDQLNKEDGDMEIDLRARMERNMELLFAHRKGKCTSKNPCLTQWNRFSILQSSAMLRRSTRWTAQKVADYDPITEPQLQTIEKGALDVATHLAALTMGQMYNNVHVGAEDIRSKFEIWMHTIPSAPCGDPEPPDSDPADEDVLPDMIACRSGKR